MGACCSTEGKYGNYKGQEVVCEKESEEESQLINGEYGASIRLHGSSDFVSLSTHQGKKGINQDSMTVWEDFTGQKGVYFCGVFDGHGPCGHDVSSYIRDQLPIKLSSLYNQVQENGLSDHKNKYVVEDDDYFEKNSSIDDTCTDLPNSVFNLWKTSILRSFQEVDKELNHDYSIDSYCSGSTAVTVIKQREHLIIGNLGDSRAVICTRGMKREVIPLQLTVDLKPNVPQEADRVKRSNGRVFALDRERWVLRLWLPDEDSPGLAMTRAFGDFCLKDYGLISTPQLFYRNLTEYDEFVVLATDGIWDVLTNFEVVKIVLAARKRSVAAKFLAAHAIRAWKSRFPTSRTDDIAIIILFLKPPPLPSKSMSSDMASTTGDSLSHLNSSISHYTSRSIASDFDEGFDFRGSSNNNIKLEQVSEDWNEADSMVDTSLNFPRYNNHNNTSSRTRRRSSSSKYED